MADRATGQDCAYMSLVAGRLKEGESAFVVMPAVSGTVTGTFSPVTLVVRSSWELVSSHMNLTQN